MNYIIIGLLAAVVILEIVNIICALRGGGKKTEISKTDRDEIISAVQSSISTFAEANRNAQKDSSNATVEAVKLLGDGIFTNQQVFEKNLMDKITTLQTNILSITAQLDERMAKISELQEKKLEQIRVTTESCLKGLQEDNSKQLDKMRETVDEKLSKTINERFEQSFAMLSNQLESVYKTLGEMKNVAGSMSNLTKALSNVKNAGIFGEVQLGALLEQILTRDQYETNIVTAEGRDPVEFAIKLPGLSEGEVVYLPIDSKFPLSVYSDLCNSYDAGDIEEVKKKQTQLKNTIREMAKDISTKYICPPRTTDFAIMFLPIEGLYAEVAKMGMIETLQSEFKVTISGPTTISALLCSLQMGFRTLAIQKKSGEVWKVLGAVKTEFSKYTDIVNKIRDKFETTSKEFDTLVGTRSRMIVSKLKSVEKLDAFESQKVLGLDDAIQSDGAALQSDGASSTDDDIDLT